MYRGADIGSCVAHEGDFSRFDFNGDGRVSVEAKARVPLHDDGTVAATPLEGTKMTDLDLFRSQWAPDAGGAEGWNADDLQTLLHSADLEVHADALFDSTARKARIEVQTVEGVQVGPERTLRRGAGFVNMTIPFDAVDDRLPGRRAHDRGRARRSAMPPTRSRCGSARTSVSTSAPAPS